MVCVSRLLLPRQMLPQVRVSFFLCVHGHLQQNLLVVCLVRLTNYKSLLETVLPSPADSAAITSGRKTSRLLGEKSKELEGISNFSPIFGIGETPETVNTSCIH